MARRRLLFEGEPGVIQGIEPTTLSFPIGIKSGPIFLNPHPQSIKVIRTGVAPLVVEFAGVGTAKDLNVASGGTNPPIINTNLIRPGGGDITVGPVQPPYIPKFKVEVIGLDKIKVSCGTNLGTNPPIDEIWRVSLKHDPAYFEFHLHQDGYVVKNYVRIEADMPDMSLNKNTDYYIGDVVIADASRAFEVAQPYSSIGGGTAYKFKYDTNYLVGDVHQSYTGGRPLGPFFWRTRFKLGIGDLYKNRVDYSKARIMVYYNGNEVDNVPLPSSNSQYYFGTSLPSQCELDDTITIKIYAPPK